MGKKLSGAAKRKKQKEKEAAIEEAKAYLERLKLGPTTLWTGLVLHHRDIFVSHVLPKLNETDRHFFAEANAKHVDLLEYAGVDVSENYVSVNECSSISTLEFLWNNMDWEENFDGGIVVNEAWSDEVVDGACVASQGYFRIACASEIEKDRTVFLFECEYREF